MTLGVRVYSHAGKTLAHEAVRRVNCPAMPHLKGGRTKIIAARNRGPDTGRTFVSATAGQAQSSLAERLGIKPSQVVQEIGYDDDCDEELRTSIESVSESELVDEDYEDVVDVVLLWWRDDDGDLFD